MKFLHNLVDKMRPAETSPLFTLHNAIETFLFVPAHTTHTGAHVRDSIDLKRTMFSVIIALLPALVFGMFNAGYQHYRWLSSDVVFWSLENFMYGAWRILPMITVTYIAGLSIEIYFAFINKHGVNEGFLVSGMLIPLIMPIDIPLWMVAVSTAFAVLFGKEVFGGTGMNVLNPALTARAFAFFAYPSWMSGDKVWIGDSAKLAAEVDGYSGATALGQLATSGSTSYSGWDAFLGFIPGSIGETSTVAILIGAAYLIYSGVGSWRIMLSGLLGAVVMGLIFNATAGYMVDGPMADYMALPWYLHLVYGSCAFALVFMATDPVSAAHTERGKLIYGFVLGLLGILIRVFNPAYPEGWMLAILLMNVFAPLVDYYVVESNIQKRLKRVKA
ncbi:MAG: NADH:ubiquinone reductase (Na(+)-transporting) subunit B [Schleiferiaceae bacterium]|jgi:Na+-transporting NADH:ubiquinone oxidoreductase subunit B|nr:NADH:ubiquinone reductase (Na(+)-transporting) subunit B [Schleiferiaceae bacterium]MDP4626738.1 NADH:ubiquinone reductase (Na(+)-transporting) subunit B [Schleiferiaceae bacterium]MDP4728849.1 NADH:ubiquinone reductase (Na(+)-transporting) subunit B [Schleiferiaceae bacterium]MDP4749857.1 NADH:ubiquinone reductase (Na(+)-transporting) subunit B [Schleiferiaceae bacterium]MDP4860045.1 NADH:ubiquinone reductase (Na(+)-transporting) subunit B [Schleiferiaceae bacterium]